jgi:excisionase family DNA binding protein
MAKKMYYNEEETSEKLGVNVDQLTELIRQRKLREYRDGNKRMFKAEEVDALAQPELTSEDSGELELAPADTAAGQEISLSEADKPREAGKEDTVITAEGISIFDEEDLEIEAADPMAKTQIAPSLDEQISVEGVGSGSGLLDLTRESDDTSLGAEVLDHIDMDESVSESTAMPAAYGQPAEPPALAEPQMVEETDPSAGLFSGLVVGSALVALLLGAVMLAVMTDTMPAYLQWIESNLAMTLGISAVVVIACGVIGLVVGKGAAQRQSAMRRAGA